MIDYYREHWYLLPALMALAALTVLVWVKALHKSAKTNSTRAAAAARIDEQKAALLKYSAWADGDISAENITEKQLFVGLALSLQKQLQYEKDQLAAFAALLEDARQLYALYFALEDEPNKLSQFFKQYGKPLTTEALDAMSRFADRDAADIFAKMYAAYDRDDDGSSLIPAQIAEWDAVFADAIDMPSVYVRAADCVRRNAPKLDERCEIMQNRRNGRG
ncbi:MAG: hypothetical protein LBJ12_05650 [Oscillospiraceae bacterium]|jgi:hypothetical protein|nr:hypothetical protein [Oscillospiraceae bacterium]